MKIRIQKNQIQSTPWFPEIVSGGLRMKPCLPVSLRACGLIIGLLCMADFSRAATFRVAPGGNDQNPGTAASPFATIAKARDVARAKGGTGHVILLAPGRYFNAGPIMLDDRDSGLTLKGEKPGAVAEIYGGLPVTSWEKWKGDIWRAPVPKDQRFYNLIVDGKPATMARTPNVGSGYGGGAKGVKRAQGANTDAVNVPKEWWGYDFNDAQVFTFDSNNWFSEMRSVMGPPDAAGNIELVLGDQNGTGRLYVQGVLEFLDEPGEWCLKSKEGFVYYWPARRNLKSDAGTETGTPKDRLIVRATCQRLFAIQGRAQETPAKNITLENLSIVGSDFLENWIIFPRGQDNSTPEPQHQGMVFGENIEKLAVKNCRLLAAGQSAVWLNKYAQACVIENNLITEAGFTGVYMNGWTIGEGPFKSVAESYVNKGHRIENNFIYDCGKSVGAGSGVQFYQSGDNLVARNEIAQMPRYGISYKSNHNNLNRQIYGQKVNEYEILHTRNNKIVGNDIHSVMRDSNDGGAIESWGVGRDNLWENNAIHDVDWSVNWTGYGVVVYADGHSNYLTQRNNIVYSCFSGYGTAFSAGGTEADLDNNLVVDCSLSRYAYASTDGPSKHSIHHNIFAFRPNSERYQVRNSKMGIKEFDCNVVIPVDPAKPNPENYAKIGVDTHSYFGDPGIKRAKPAWDIQYADYSLKSDSPAFKLGYKNIPTNTIGLRKNFPFNTAAVTRRSAFDKIQAEAYQRMRDLRTRGGVGIHEISKGAWAKYQNIDFGKGQATGAELVLENGEAPKGPIELRLDAPNGPLLGVFPAGKKECQITRVTGGHHIYLVFPEGGKMCVDWFRFR
jgi:hypothetical protein